MTFRHIPSGSIEAHSNGETDSHRIQICNVLGPFLRTFDGPLQSFDGGEIRQRDWSVLGV